MLHTLSVAILVQGPLPCICIYIYIPHIHVCLGSRVCPNDLVQRRSRLSRFEGLSQRPCTTGYNLVSYVYTIYHIYTCTTIFVCFHVLHIYMYKGIYIHIDSANMYSCLEVRLKYIWIADVFTDLFRVVVYVDCATDGGLRLLETPAALAAEKVRLRNQKKNLNRKTRQRQCAKRQRETQQLGAIPV